MNELYFGNGRTITGTLDFTYWQEEGKILHEYYEKSMKTPLVIMKRSAMCQSQKISILTNELIRRLSNISESLPDTVRVKVIDKFTCQMKNSGYDRMEILEMVMSALRGFKRKVERRKEAGEEFYRSERVHQAKE